MYNKYEMVCCHNKDLITIYKRYYIHEGYVILISDDTVLIVKKYISDIDIKSELEHNIINIIVQYAHKYYSGKLLYIDFSSTVNEINKIANNDILKENDANVTWRIRQAFIKAITLLNKKEQEDEI